MSQTVLKANPVLERAFWGSGAEVWLALSEPGKGDGERELRKPRKAIVTRDGYATPRQDEMGA